MRKVAMTVAAAAFTIGTLATATGMPTARADQTTPAPPTPTVQLLACNGTTGDHGCGPGFYWRNGDHGWACYPCN
jgi:hypothetical protein